MDRVGPKAKLPVPFLHEPELFTTPVGVAAKLCTGAAAEDGLGEAFCRHRCITVETVSAVGASGFDAEGHRAFGLGLPAATKMRGIPSTKKGKWA